MSHLKKYVALLIAMIVPLAFVGSANAANETVSATSEISPRSGSFFKEASVASNLKFRADVTTPASSPKVNPLKNVKFTFPGGTDFNPKKSMPVCTDAKLSADSVLNDPPGVIAACKDSVVGTGIATIILAKINNNPNTVIDDPVLVLFNNGRDNKGNAKVKIWGYSKTTNYGILMQATMVKSVLDVKVPVLSNDSAARVFEMELPGPRLNRPDINVDVKGLDNTFVQARCATGTLRTSADFLLGERDFATGLDVPGTEATATSPVTTQDCVGKAGNAKLGGVKVKGPNAVKRGKQGAFKVTVKNTGTATAKNVVVTSNRGGKAKIAKLAPGASKTVTVKAKIQGKKGKKVNVKFTAKSGKVKASAAKKVRVK